MVTAVLGGLTTRENTTIQIETTTTPFIPLPLTETPYASIEMETNTAPTTIIDFIDYHATAAPAPTVLSPTMVVPLYQLRMPQVTEPLTQL